MEHLLKRLPSAPPLVVDLLVELMGILASYNITVKELKMLFSAMKAVDNKWVRYYEQVYNWKISIIDLTIFCSRVTRKN